MRERCCKRERKTKEALVEKLLGMSNVADLEGLLIEFCPNVRICFVI